MNKGRLVLVSGPSGAGKSTVLHRVLAQHPDYFFSVSVTTRDPRPGERDGVDYHFITTEAFREMIRREELLEYNHYASGDYYGTPALPIRRIVEQGGTAVLDVEPNGMLQVQRWYPDALTIFLAPPNLEELRRRLENRGDTRPEKIEARLRQAVWELQQAHRYTYLVVNRQIEPCVAEVEAILAGAPGAERCRYEHNTDLEIFKEAL